MSALRYRAPSADAVRIAALGDITGIFHRASGITHLVVTPVPELLAAMADAPRSVDDLEAMFDLQDGGRDALIVRLDELVEAGLLHTA